MEFPDSKWLNELAARNGLRLLAVQTLPLVQSWL
jgi:hypothetical protein